MSSSSLLKRDTFWFVYFQSFTKLQSQLNPAKLARKIPTDTPMRWNSKYFILQVTAGQRLTTDAMFSTSELAKLQNLKLSDQEWSCISDLLKLLAPFETGTPVVFSKRFPTISTVIPLVKKLKNHTQKFPVEHRS